jgi:hypothetical protein
MTALLGVLQLGNRPMLYKGCLNTPETFPFPILCRMVPGAWVANVVPGDPSIKPAWIQTASHLVAEGATAITSNCGFALRYQRALAAAVPVPVMLSSLVLLPALLAALPSGRMLGIVTFDAGAFSPDLLDLASVPQDAPLRIIGIEGTASHAEMCKPDNAIGLPMLEADVATRVLAAAADGRLGGLLFECAGFGCVSQAVRKATGLPIWDAVDAAVFAMAGTKLAGR